MTPRATTSARSADYSEAIALDPKYVAAYENRGLAHRATYEYDRSIVDYSQAIALDPKNVSEFENRGISYYFDGDHAKALADLNRANEIDPKYAYTACLWLEIVAQRANVPSRLSQAAGAIDQGVAWPAPIVRLYL